MSNLYDFLVEHGKFPFPAPCEDQSTGTTDVSHLEVALLEKEWKANHAVRDNTLVEKLCSTLENTIGDTFLEADIQNIFLALFSPRLQHGWSGRKDRSWSQNPSKRSSWTLLHKGVFEALAECLWEYGRHDFWNDMDNVADGGSSKVDFVLQVDGEDRTLVEVESPSIMKKVGELLPPRGIELTWARGQPLVPRILAKAALYLGLRRMEWLFFTCHNYWIVCRLVRDDDHPFLAYSPMISIEDSSAPFRALLSATLSVVKKVSVEPSEFSPNMEFDIIVEEQPKGPLPNDEADGSTHPVASNSPNTHHAEKLMITSSSPSSPESFQIWIHLHSCLNNTLALPPCAKSEKQRLWLTKFLGAGSTGNVWECRFDGSDDLFATKIVEVLRHSHESNRQRLHDEFKIYLALEKAYQSGRLRHRITPSCYGAFESDYVNILIFDLCDGILDDWRKLSDSERSQIYKMVRNLHRIGILHGDLEPRNIGRTRVGGFYLIDFSESRRHVCRERKARKEGTQAASSQKQICVELQTLRDYLWKQKPLQDDHVNLG